jgi:hypothetical protein
MTFDMHHFQGLGLREEADLIVAFSAELYRSDLDEVPSHVSKNLVSHQFKTSNRVLLREQRDAQAEHWKARRDQPDEGEAWAKLVKYNELLRRAETGEYGADP